MACSRGPQVDGSSRRAAWGWPGNGSETAGSGICLFVENQGVKHESPQGGDSGSPGRRQGRAGDARSGARSPPRAGPFLARDADFSGTSSPLHRSPHRRCVAGSLSIPGPKKSASARALTPETCFFLVLQGFRAAEPHSGAGVWTSPKKSVHSLISILVT